MFHHFVEGKVIFVCTIYIYVTEKPIQLYVQLCIGIQHNLTLHVVTSLDLWTKQIQTYRIISLACYWSWYWYITTIMIK